MILNTIMADSFEVLADEIEGHLKKGVNLKEAIIKVIQSNLKKYHGVMFNGNNYSQEWQQEAAKRKLWNLATGMITLSER